MSSLNKLSLTPLCALVDNAKAKFAECESVSDLENAKALFLGKAGSITSLLKNLSTLAAAEKKAFEM